MKGDDVIDLTSYRDRNAVAPEAGSDRANFSVFGGDGDRSRFALPVWRLIYLVGGLVWIPKGSSSSI